MSVLTFRGRGSGESEVCSGDWTRQELADFYRAHRLLVQNGVDIGLDRGLSDEGDPWAVFFDAETQDVFLHIARINGVCVLVSDALDIQITETSIAKLVTAFEASILRLVSTRAAGNSNVILHPVTRILIAISAVFLVFKLENGAAYAKGLGSDHAGASADASKKSDSLIAHRAALTVQRLYELVDTPSVVAAAAGVLVTIEISKIAPSLTADETVHILHETPALEPAINLELPHDGQQPQMQVEHVVRNGELAAHLDQQSRILVVAQADATDLTAPPVDVPPPQMWVEPQAEDAAVGSSSSAEPASTTTLSSARLEATVDSDAGKTDEVAQPDSKPDLSALELIKAVMAQVEATSGSGVFATLGSDADDVAVDTTSDVDGPIGDISLRDLDILSETVGFHYVSNADGGKLIDALAALIEQFGSVGIEYAASDVLIEQAHIEDAPVDSVGLWVNVMSDGSRIAVVGSSDIVDDVLGAGLAVLA